MSPAARAYDAVVIGAGLGGLLAAAYIARAGGAVLMLERLRYAGGRFTTVDQHGFAITTGALHMAPHGGRGPLARAMCEVGAPFAIVPRDVLASFYLHGEHVQWKQPLDVMRLFTARARADLLKVTALLSLPFASARAEAQPFSEWLASQTSERALHQFFDSFVEFAVSVRSHQISFGEMRAIHQNVLKYGMPGTPVGGCRGVVAALTDAIQANGGDIRLGTDVLRILTDRRSERARGVEFRDRRGGSLQSVQAPIIVSDAGPDVTRTLLCDVGAVLFPDSRALPKAAGLKLHITSDRSLIPHNGIMLCLDTRRVSGMVEVSRAVPSVAPAGRHMINTFQVMRSDSMTDERDLAIADLRDIFGDDFDRHCRVLRTSAFRDSWPVNQAMQGRDLRDQEPLPGLLMVGDAYKPRGHMMAEGVAASVRRIVPRLRGSAGAIGTPAVTPRAALTAPA